MKKYKLKAQARQFFDSFLAKEINDLKWWNAKLISIELLDEVSMVYIKYGHTKSSSSGGECTDLSGWKSEGKEAEFLFTVKVLDIANKDYERVDIPHVMDEIQDVLDNYFKNKYQHQ